MIVQQKYFYPPQFNLIIGLLIEKVKVGNHKYVCLCVRACMCVCTLGTKMLQGWGGSRSAEEQVFIYGGSQELSRI